MDDVQLEDSSVMVRNKFLENTGTEKLLSLNVEKKGYLVKIKQRPLTYTLADKITDRL